MKTLEPLTDVGVSSGKTLDWKSFSATAGSVLIAQLSYASAIGGLLLFYCGSFVFGKFSFISPVFFSLMDVSYILIDGVTVVPFFIVILFMGLFLQFPFVSFITGDLDRRLLRYEIKSKFIIFILVALVLIFLTVLLAGAIALYVDMIGIVPSIFMSIGIFLASIVFFSLRRIKNIRAFTPSWIKLAASIMFCGIFTPSILLIGLGYLSVMEAVRNYDDNKNYINLDKSTVKLVPIVFSKDYLFVFDGEKFLVLKTDILASSSIIRDYKSELPTGVLDSFLERLVKQELSNG